jgi:hypothetical protein
MQQTTSFHSLDSSIGRESGPMGFMATILRKDRPKIKGFY